MLALQQSSKDGQRLATGWRSTRLRRAPPSQRRPVAADPTGVCAKITGYLASHYRAQPDCARALIVRRLAINQLQFAVRGTLEARVWAFQGARFAYDRDMQHAGASGKSANSAPCLWSVVL